MTAAAPATKATKATVLQQPLVALQGGPRHNWWYFEVDWEQLRSNADRLPKDLAQDDVLAYTKTRVKVAHPDGVNTGTAWRHRDATSRRPARRRPGR